MRPLAQMLARQRGHLFEWVPVMLACGIGFYFLLRMEPSALHLAAAAGVAVVLVGFGLFQRLWGAPLLLALGMVALGFALAGMRAHMVAGPVLEHRYYGAVTGRVVALDRSASDRLRVTLDRVVLERMTAADTPLRVRIALHETSLGLTRFVPGQVIMATAHLSPPQGPVEPGGFDFQRHAWFKRLGAVGYTRVPVLLWQGPGDGPALAVHRARMAMSSWVQGQLPGTVGRFAAALMTGDRSGMDADTLADLRRTNLAHLLAISGLHMGLLTGFVFAALRVVMAAVPVVALRLPVKKLAAIGALVAGAGYLVLSGASVATERAFVMVAVMFAAVLFDRRAISLRAIALAAIIVLVLRPESLLSPGFQMSFAATTALVAAFSTLRDISGFRLPAALKWVGALVMSSAVAGAATAPFAAAHFNIFASYGLLANLASVPLMGTVVMPGAVIAVLLAPFGLEVVGFTLVRGGLEWILGVADRVAAMDGAVTYIPSPAGWTLPLVSLGGLTVALWQGNARLIGVVPVVVVLVFWGQAERPALLISEQAGLVGVLGEEGRALSRARGEGFAARAWLENDGDGVVQKTAFDRSGLETKLKLTRQHVMGVDIVHLSGKRGREATELDCAGADILVVAANLNAKGWPCKVLDRSRLRKSGAIAGHAENGTLRLISVADVRGQRLWSPPSRQ